MVSGSIINLKDIKKWKKKDTDARVILMSTITPKEQQAFANAAKLLMPFGLNLQLNIFKTLQQTHMFSRHVSFTNNMSKEIT
jgi:hypothetical protein